MSQDISTLPRFLDVIDTKNEDYKVTDVCNSVPFRVDAERAGASAINVYLRSQNRVEFVVLSEFAARDLRDALNRELGDS